MRCQGRVREPDDPPRRRHVREVICARTPCTCRVPPPAGRPSVAGRRSGPSAGRSTRGSRLPSPCRATGWRSAAKADSVVWEGPPNPPSGSARRARARPIIARSGPPATDLAGRPAGGLAGPGGRSSHGPGRTIGRGPGVPVGGRLDQPEIRPAGALRLVVEVLRQGCCEKRCHREFLPVVRSPPLYRPGVTPGRRALGRGRSRTCVRHGAIPPRTPVRCQQLFRTDVCFGRRPGLRSCKQTFARGCDRAANRRAKGTHGPGTEHQEETDPRLHLRSGPRARATRRRSARSARRSG